MTHAGAALTAPRHSREFRHSRESGNLFTQHPKRELEDFSNWAKSVKPSQGDGLYRINGAGEMLVYSAADFEDFLDPRPDMLAGMEADLTAVVRLLAQNRWPTRPPRSDRLGCFRNVIGR